MKKRITICIDVKDHDYGLLMIHINKLEESVRRAFDDTNFDVAVDDIDDEED